MKMVETEAILRELMIASQAGSASEYRRLLEALKIRLDIFFRRRLADPSAAEDLVQEALMTIHVKRDTYDPAQPFTAWAYAIARYKLVDHFRRNRIRAHVPIDEVDFLGEADTGFAAAEARLDVERMMETLPEGQANALRLTKLDELSVAEAAEKSRSGISAIKVNVHRGLKALMARRGDQEN
ncbi:MULTISPECIES: sigma-70 family RNA polymerase sigma factor [Alphaproteobacteria]|jgi:RNA polymerase sigma-70 factor (ECF subfamily)|uniref:RNA polymerase sigma factor n=1 Tax=Maricaulis virginensis TaxID=144022 RepID=A0A9W6MQ81_9PROT|nr:sigma-70 family RNA polymerase sigma factor [Maricaulis virginensis]GLK53937.1 RNA polymerase sigma factor [Maricaulis virginensis]